MQAPGGETYRGEYWRIADGWASDAGAVMLAVEVYASAAARQAGEAALYSVPASVPWCDLGWAPGQPAPTVTREALYRAVKAGARFVGMGDG
jgi:hypothetical protein